MSGRFLLVHRLHQSEVPQWTGISPGLCLMGAIPPISKKLPLSRCKARRGKLTVKFGAVQHCDQLIAVVCLCRKNARVRPVEAVRNTKYMWRSGVERCWVVAGEWGSPFCPPSLATRCKRSSVVCWLGRTFLSHLWYVPATWGVPHQPNRTFRYLTPLRRSKFVSLCKLQSECVWPRNSSPGGKPCASVS